MGGRRILSSAAAAAYILSLAVPIAAAYDPTDATERMSVDSSEVERAASSGNGANSTDISYDGRFAVFDTYADFDPADTDGQPDAYARDRLLGTTTLLDTDSAGVVGNSFSFDPTVNADGRYVAFVSASTNLVAGDTNGILDIFVRDTADGSVVRVSVASDGSQATGDSSRNPSISADGRFVAFSSNAILAPTDTGNASTVYVHDRDVDADGVFDEAGAIATVQVDVATDGTPANGGSYGKISPNGRFVVLGSEATNLAPTDDPLCEYETEDPENPGQFITLPRNCSDIFLHDRDADDDGVFDEAGGVSTTMVSVTELGVQADNDSGDPDVADDGDVAFWSYADNLGGPGGSADAYVWERDTGAIQLVGSSQSNGPSMSNSGRYVAFDSGLSHGGVPDTNNAMDAWVYDRVAGTHVRASVDFAGGEVSFGSYDPVMSGDGRHVLFGSYAGNLAPGVDGGFDFDVFARDLLGAPAGTPTDGSTPVTPVDPITNGSPVTLTFDAVTTPGETFLSTSSDGPAPISGFSLGEPPTYYDISTTATFSGSIEICISYAGITFPAGYPIRLFHFEMGVYRWVDITTSVDATNQVVCGQTTSLSPFAIFVSESLYAFGGFSPPVDDSPTLNVLKAGAAVPVRFSLGGDFGLDIFAAGSPTSQRVECDTGVPTDKVETTVTASASGLTYSPGSDVYTYTWKTSKSWAGSCRDLRITLSDGTEAVAHFKFT